MEQQGLIYEITRIAEPAARALGLELWGVELVPCGRMAVRIYVDTPPGTGDAAAKDRDMDECAAGGKGPDVGQCAAMSRHVGLALDAEDIISCAYVLEVSSPGLERPFFTLAQLAPYVGSELALKLESPQAELPERKHLRGRLLDVGGNAFTLLVRDAPEETRLSICWDAVRKATLAPELPFSTVEKNRKKKSASKADTTSK